MTGGSDVFFWVENLHARYFFGSRDLCDVEQGAQTNSILLITPENIEKVESILQNIIAQGGTPENKRKVGKIVKHH